MSVPRDKYRALVEKLYTSTADKSLAWQIEPFTEELCTALGRYKVVLETGEDAEGSPFVAVRLKNNVGDEVDSFSDTTVSGGTPKLSDFSSYWILMTTLYTAARRAAMGADEALDEVLSELDADDDEVPF